MGMVPRTPPPPPVPRTPWEPRKKAKVLTYSAYAVAAPCGAVMFWGLTWVILFDSASTEPAKPWQVVLLVAVLFGIVVSFVLAAIADGIVQELNAREDETPDYVQWLTRQDVHDLSRLGDAVTERQWYRIKKDELHAEALRMNRQRNDEVNKQAWQIMSRATNATAKMQPLCAVPKAVTSIGWFTSLPDVPDPHYTPKPVRQTSVMRDHQGNVIGEIAGPNDVTITEPEGTPKHRPKIQATPNPDLIRDITA